MALKFIFTLLIMFRKQLARAILNASAERSQHKIECQQMARGAAAGISRCAAIAITRRST